MPQRRIIKAELKPIFLGKKVVRVAHLACGHQAIEHNTRKKKTVCFNCIPKKRRIE